MVYSALIEGLKLIQCLIGKFDPAHQIEGIEKLIDHETIADMKYVFSRSGGFILLCQIIRDLSQSLHNDTTSRIIIFTLDLMREFVSESSKTSTSEDVVENFYRYVRITH